MVTLQPATLDDLESLAQQYEELSGEPTDFKIMQENFKIMEASPNYIILIAKEANFVVGSLMGIICLDLVGKCRPFMVIENVIVRKDWRGRGIATKLMERIEEIGRKRDCYYTMFVSGSHRKEAHQFYKAVGYNLDLVQGFKKFL